MAVSDRPKRFMKQIQQISDQRIRFVSFLPNTIGGVFFAALFFAGLIFAIVDPSGKVGASIELGVLAIIPIPFFLYMAIPRAIELDFNGRKYIASAGIGKFVRRRIGSLDEINSVYVSVNSRGPYYTLGLAFGKATGEGNTSIIPMILPQCELIQTTEKSRIELWTYSQDLAKKIGVPCKMIGWHLTD
jgi:hypothetical protein